MYHNINKKSIINELNLRRFDGKFAFFPIYKKNILIIDIYCVIINSDKFERINFMTSELTLNRSLYKEIKSMNREKLQGTLAGIYQNGYNDAMKNNTSELNLENLRNELSAVNGIGQKRLDEIMSIIEKSLSTQA